MTTNDHFVVSMALYERKNFIMLGILFFLSVLFCKKLRSKLVGIISSKDYVIEKK